MTTGTDTTCPSWCNVGEHDLSQIADTIPVADRFVAHRSAHPIPGDDVWLGCGTGPNGWPPQIWCHGDEITPAQARAGALLEIADLAERGG